MGSTEEILYTTAHEEVAFRPSGHATIGQNFLSFVAKGTEYLANSINSAADRGDGGYQRHYPNESDSNNCCRTTGEEDDGLGILVGKLLRRMIPEGYGQIFNAITFVVFLWLMVCLYFTVAKTVKFLVGIFYPHPRTTPRGVRRRE